VLICLLLASALAAADEPLRFTAIPDADTSRLTARFGKVANYLAEVLGVPVEYVAVKSYAASVAAFKNGEVQLAWFGGLSGVKARLAVPGSRAIAQGVEDLEFVTYFIAHHSTGLSESDSFPAAIAGKTFTFGSKGSTSGRLMPDYFIRQHFDKSPDEVFERVGFSGDHSKTLAMVQSGSYQVGALNYKVWETELAAGKVDTGRVRIIWRTPSYPDYNWTLRADVNELFGEGFGERVQKALLDLDDRALLDTFPRRRFIAADNTMYKPILETGRVIGVFRE
jgi:phosphonate transport system substrate-binding protein